MKAPRPGVNRRELLRLRRSKDGTSALKHQVREEPGRYASIRAHRPAMGSYFEVRLPASIPGAVDLACRSLDVIELLESRMTVYRDNSEVSRLNATAHLGPVEVEHGLFDLLEMAVGLSRETDGAYDVAEARRPMHGDS